MTAKIVQFTPFFPPHKGGLENYAQERANQRVQNTQGKLLQVTFSPGQTINDGLYNTQYYQVLVLPAFEIVHNFPVPKVWQKAFWDGVTHIKSFQGDTHITHTRFFLSTFLGGILAKIRKKQRIHVEHGSGHIQGLPLRKKFFADLYDRTVGLFSFRLADHIMTISQANIPFIQKFTKKTVHVTYRGFELPPKFDKKHKKGEPIHIGFVGRITGLKGINYLIEAIHALHTQEKNIKVTIVGDGDMKQEYEQLSHKLGLDQIIKFLGAKDNVRTLKEFYPNIDIFVNPSLQEGLPTTVLEALANGCIVVATDVGGTKEISNQEDLIIVLAKESGALAKAIIKAIKHLDQQRKSYDTLKERFSWNTNVKKYYDIVLNLKQ